MAGNVVSDKASLPPVLAALCRQAGLPLPVAEYQFASPRRWLFDWAWCYDRVAVEVEGGVWRQGRHNRAKGYISDMEKYNTAVLNGWRVLRYTPQQWVSGVWVEDVRRLVKGG